jgi:hypothetical protein
MGLVDLGVFERRKAGKAWVFVAAEAFRNKLTPGAFRRVKSRRNKELAVTRRQADAKPPTQPPMAEDPQKLLPLENETS